MKIFNFLKRKKTPGLRRKSFPLGMFADFLAEYGHSDLAAYASILLFDKTAPLSSAVDILSSEVSSLTPIIKEKKNGKEEIVKEHPVLDLLKNPNADSTGVEFLYQLCAFYAITGNSYLAATGPVNREPLELFSIYPQTVVYIEPDAWDGLAASFTVQTGTDSLIYKRQDAQRRFRFYYRDEAELWQIKRFNPNAKALVGQTPISGILAEVDWYNLSSTHNVSLLKRGARPSGILLVGPGDSGGKGGQLLTEPQYERLKEQFRLFSGAANSGKSLILDIDAKLKWENLLTTNQEMDFMGGRKDTRQTIYLQYKIPLPFIASERQTFSNLQSANEQLYDNAIIPLADRLFEELNIFLMPRYKRSEKLRLTYDKSSIPALQARKTREVKERGETGIYTINELRTMSGAEALDEGGDMLYRPASMVPIAQDQYVADQFSQPQKTSKARFREIMLSKGYPEEKIERMANDLRLK
ncbi:MAG: phage portal protein [Phycisphaerales bacterium]|jgi:HK97 family phage portal protein